MEAAAAFPLATLTAWRMCVTRARVRAGDTVLIWGIGGGVALAALGSARPGARRSGSRRTARRSSRGLGRSAQTRRCATDRTWTSAEVRARTGKRGVDVVIDNVGDATWTQSLGALGRRGRLVTCGATSGPMVEMDVRRLFWNQWTLMGSTMGTDAEFDAITREFAAGRLTAGGRFRLPLDRGRDALARLESGNQFGKVVVRIS